MKESKLIQMEKNIDTSGRVLNQVIQEMRMMDERLHGLTMFIQKLPDYDKIIKELKDELKAKAEGSKDEDPKLDIGT